MNFEMEINDERLAGDEVNRNKTNENDKCLS